MQHNTKGILAIHGGEKTITRKFKSFNTIGEQEKKAVIEVMESGVLSRFLGSYHDDFCGGDKVKEFEQLCCETFGVQYAISVNSWTSGLIAAVGAIGIEPGDEVIVPPWTMCASATAILHWNAIPVFADIEPDMFCIDPKSVKKCITHKTKAIMAVDIFGQSADIDALKEIAANHGLKIISDSAQSPGALYKGKHAGTLTDVGGFSLNYHKHIHTGEGGIIVTNDSNIAERLQLIRNHGEAVVGSKGLENISNILGYNFRLGEIESAIGIEQLKKLHQIIEKKQVIAERLSSKLVSLEGVKVPKIRKDCTHVYYGYPLILDVGKLNIQRDVIYEALKAEGIPVTNKYQNLHLLPMYQKKIAYGNGGFPWTAKFSRTDIRYYEGQCPVSESLNSQYYLGLGLFQYDLTNEDIDDIAKGFYKVWDNLISLS